MNRQSLRDKLIDLKSQIPSLRNLHPKSHEDVFCRWKEEVACTILEALNNDVDNPFYARIDNIFSEGSRTVPAFKRDFLTPQELSKAEPIIAHVINLIEDELNSISSNKDTSKLTVLYNIFQNFHRFHKQLQNRQNNEPPIQIDNEYALQDFIHAILCLHYRDVENEVSLPKYCGKASRIDFLLKKEEIGIEIKFVTDKIKSKLRQQLLEDKEQYKKSNLFKEIIFFIYDPKMVINKPEVFKDIEEQTGNCIVKVFVSPKY